MLGHSCNHRTAKIEVEESEVQGHPLQHREFDLGYMRPQSKEEIEGWMKKWAKERRSEGGKGREIWSQYF